MEPNYRLGIVGSRHYDNYPEFCSNLNQLISIYGLPTKVISGGHLSKNNLVKPGADTLAWKWANDNHIPITEYEAEWDIYGRAAGPIRNKLIVNDIDVLIAFVAPNSSGTRNTISLAQKQPHIKIYVVNVL